MTCILSLAAPGYVVQVSDRRLSYVTNGQPFTDDANKAIIFRATDGYMAIAYTGVAYVGSIPTDKWIAQCLWGGEVQEGVSRLGGRAAAARVSDALQLLRRSMDRHAGTFKGLELLVGGYRQVGEIAAPFSIRLTRKLGAPTVVAGHLRLRTPTVQVTGAGVTPSRWEYEVAQRALFDRAPGVVSAEQVAQMLSDLVRVVATRAQTVGLNLMTTILSPRLRVTCAYSPFSADGGPAIVLDTATEQRSLGPATFSPWVVGQSSVHGTTANIGGWTAGVEGLEVAMEDHPHRSSASSGVFFAMTGAPQPPRP